MKRMMSVLIAALLVFGIGGAAKASFDNAGVVRIVYRTDGAVEVATSLGNVADFVAGSDLTVGAGSLGINLADFGTGASFNNLRVAYWASDLTTGEAWVSGNPAFGVPTTGILGAFDAFQTVTNSVQSYYRQLPGGLLPDPVKIIGDKNNFDAYWNRMNSGGGTTGKFKTFMDDGNAEISLAALANPGGYVDFGFYKWDYEEYGAAGDLVATIRTALGVGGIGETIVNPTGGPVVPVPAAVWLLGTGLVGLVGIRRRKS